MTTSSSSVRFFQSMGSGIWMGKLRNAIAWALIQAHPKEEEHGRSYRCCKKLVKSTQVVLSRFSGTKSGKIRKDVRRVMRKFLPALVVSAVVLAQSNPNGGAADAEKKKIIRIEGRVTSLNGEVVRKATVRLQPAFGPQLAAPPAPGAQANQIPSTYSESSDEAGKFVFENVAPGRYTLTSEKTGFVTQRYGARSDTSPGTPLVLEAGNELKDVAIQMTPQAVIAGRVTDQDGDPVANIGVSVFRYGYTNGRRTLTPGGGPAAGGRGGPIGPGGPGGTSTDDQGNFRIGNLSPGRYYVSADPRGGNGLIGPVQEQPGRAAAAPKATDVTTFYPNALDAKSAAPVDVGAGGEIRGIEIRFRRERTYSIRGKAVDTTIGGPAVNAYVLVVPPNTTAVGPATLSNMTRTSADGSFEIRNLR